MKSGVVVVFPGTGYTCKERLLDTCIKKYISFGYEIVSLDFSDIQYKEINKLEDAVKRTNKVILKQLKGINFDEYENIIFISKSLGTVCANWIEEYMNIKPRQLYLTPLKETISTMKITTRVMGMVIGKDDKHFDYKEMELFCLERKIPYLVFDGVGHNLKVNGDILQTEKINMQIVKLCLTN